MPALRLSVNSKKQTVAFDFDGVIHSYKSGWQGIDNIPDPPVDGVRETIDELREIGYSVVIYSTRCSTDSGRVAVHNYLENNDIIVDGLYADKPPAICYVDDRAICFDGNVSGLVDKIQDFKSWTEEY